MIDKIEKEKIRTGLKVAIFFIAVLWIFKMVEVSFDISFVKLGIYPRDVKGLIGIITVPFIHKDFMHLFNNTVPLFLSIMAIIYFFRPAAFNILIFIYLTTNVLIWIFARENYHIGASGLVYAYLSFLFFGGAFATNRNLLAISLIIIFLYGSLFWGILPVDTTISWESHLIGAIMGLVFSFIYRKHAIVEKKYDWEDEEDDDDDFDATDIWEFTNDPN